jgi:serine/threonine protein kinase
MIRRMGVPERIGRYRVLGLVGHGAMGVVYRGRDESLDRDVALKLIRGAGSAEDRVRFLREARAAARLQHPNIVTIYEAGEHEGAPFMAMELLEGVDLQRAIEAGLRPDPKVTLPIVLQLLAGLSHAHEHGIVHRDVKPSNLFLPRGRPAKIMDFGIARLAGGTAATGIVGTPNYMSPEQVRGEPLDGRSDLFSAGLILYELVTGEKAYQGDSVVALVYKIAHEDPDLSLLPRGEKWHTLRAVVERSLAREPDARYADARSMQDELFLVLGKLGGVADWTSASDLGLMSRTPRPRTEAAPLVPPPAPAPTAPAVGAAASPRRPQYGLGLAAAAVIALLIASALIVARSPRATTTPSPPTTLSASVAPTAAPAPVPPVSTGPTTPSPPSPPSRAPASARPPPHESPAAEAKAPVPAAGRIDRANELLEKGRFASALAEARAVLRRDPGNAEAKMIAEEAEAATVVETRLGNAREALKRGDREAALAEVKAGLAVRSSDSRLLALFRELTQ